MLNRKEKKMREIRNQGLRQTGKGDSLKKMPLISKEVNSALWLVMKSFDNKRLVDDCSIEMTSGLETFRFLGR